MTTTETAYAGACRRMADALENHAAARGNGEERRTSEQLAQADDLMIYIRGKWQQEHVKEVRK
jgi:hypothetical protein